MTQRTMLGLDMGDVIRREVAARLAARPLTHSQVYPPSAVGMVGIIIQRTCSVSAVRGAERAVCAARGV